MGRGNAALMINNTAVPDVMDQTLLTYLADEVLCRPEQCVERPTAHPTARPACTTKHHNTSCQSRHGVPDQAHWMCYAKPWETEHTGCQPQDERVLVTQVSDSQAGWQAVLCMHSPESLGRRLPVTPARKPFMPAPEKLMEASLSGRSIAIFCMVACMTAQQHHSVMDPSIRLIRPSLCTPVEHRSAGGQ